MSSIGVYVKKSGRSRGSGSGRGNGCVGGHLCAPDHVDGGVGEHSFSESVGGRGEGPAAVDHRHLARGARENKRVLWDEIRST